MPGPKPNPMCPKCDQRPRRGPGLMCQECHNNYTRSRRRRRREDQSEVPRFSRPLRGTRFLITSAQNATPAHKPFLEALQVAARRLKAEIVVVPLRYKNPTSQWTAAQERDDWWDPALEPYLFNERRKLGPNLVLAADVKTQPTAKRPLSGFESLTGAESCVIAHPKMAYQVVPRPPGCWPKVLSTTGSVTQRNYTDTKAGKLGEFHHYLGALLVELKGRRFHLRQLNADTRTGEFIDLNVLYTREGAQQSADAAGLVLGDTHARFTCPKVDGATFGKGGVVETLRPREVVFHDLFDGWSVNPHHEGNPFIALAKYRSASGSVLSEVRHAVEYVSSRCKGRQAVIAASNHDNFLSRWVINTDWRRAPVNAEFYLETAAAMVRSTRTDGGGAKYGDPFTHWVQKLKGRAPIRCLDVDESHLIAGVEVAMHGDRGPNGGRATMANMARLGAKVITGHAHTPGIEEGHYRVGTSSPLRLEYTRGPSSWLNTHCVVYANGKRALITIIDGEWRA